MRHQTHIIITYLETGTESVLTKFLFLKGESNPVELSFFTWKSEYSFGEHNSESFTEYFRKTFEFNEEKQISFEEIPLDMSDATDRDATALCRINADLFLYQETTKNNAKYSFKNE